MTLFPSPAPTHAFDLEARAIWHLQLDPEQLYHDQREQPTYTPVADFEFYPDDEDDFDEDRTCEYCSGDGGDPWNDYIMECPACLGEGVRW